MGHFDIVYIRLVLEEKLQLILLLAVTKIYITFMIYRKNMIDLYLTISYTS